MITLSNLNFDEALRYMGCKKNNTDDNTTALLNKCESLVISHSIPRYCYREFDIKETTQGIEVIGTNLVLKGNDIKNHLSNCFGIVIMCATLSNSIDTLIRKAQLEDMSKAVVINSLASVAIEQVCNKVEEKIYTTHQNCYKTFRYSPGYGDLPITLQRDILNILDAPRKIGLCVNQSFMLTPIKSVTAIIGLSDTEITAKSRGCLDCNLKNTCQYRKVGNRCV
ncbi:MAG: vitamin B12 dependent-methionine synthase activation domain-containing protein [Acutalibacteraceae bacterium]|nr:vitamin B12 dependent-methionine synthase activation domain-containing protein [Acutalibacteraceae bacterium]